MPRSPTQALRIRMYRLGVGDCFLLTLPKRDGGDFRMLVDCGIHTSEKGGRERVRKAASDVMKVTGNALDLIVGTHEHWDHLSGFLHGKDIFVPGCAAAIWCAWTENMDDPVARGLLNQRDKAVTALWGAARHLHMHPGGGTARDWSGLVGFFGDSPGVGPRAREAAAALKALAASPAGISYHAPGEPPFDAVSDDWRIFVLGPPRDRDRLRHADPTAPGEAYPLAAAAAAEANLSAALAADDDPPFDRRYQLDLEGTRGMEFFRQHYWADTAIRAPKEGTDDDEDQEERMQDWRRIGASWLDGAETLALKLDRITNNTSLVLALELGPKAARDNPVVLLAADAQVGNWQSWPAVEWPDYHGRRVTGADLVARTIVYKVGHHASHNATLMEGGLETMTRLRLALVPTSAEMADSVGWGTLPWPSLLKRLKELASGGVLRSDKGADFRAVPGIRLDAEETTHFDVTVSFEGDPS